MTDKEKAEKYVEDYKTKDGRSLDYCDILKAYNDGLEEGKPKWHDLRKDPNDLPQRSGLYCVQCGEVREYVKEEKSWFTVHFEPCMNCTEETYLWCELPKFEE